MESTKPQPGVNILSLSIKSRADGEICWHKGTRWLRSLLFNRALHLMVSLSRVQYAQTCTYNLQNLNCGNKYSWCLWCDFCQWHVAEQTPVIKLPPHFFLNRKVQAYFIMRYFCLILCWIQCYYCLLLHRNVMMRKKVMCA